MGAVRLCVFEIPAMELARASTALPWTPPRKYSREAAINTVLELAIEDTVKLGDGPWRLDLGGYPRYVACTRCGPQAMAGVQPPRERIAA